MKNNVDLYNTKYFIGQYVIYTIPSTLLANMYKGVRTNTRVYALVLDSPVRLSLLLLYRTLFIFAELE